MVTKLLDIRAEYSTFSDEPKMISAPEAHVFYVYVCNRSDWDVVGAIYGGGYHELEDPISRTCSEDYAQCKQDQSYVPLLQKLCTDSPFPVTLLKNSKDGKTGVSPMFRVEPVCTADDGTEYSGGVINLIGPA
jgi:hypothetical protein